MEWKSNSRHTLCLMLNGQVIGYVQKDRKSGRFAWYLTTIQSTPDLRTAGQENTQEEAKEKAESVWQEWATRYGLDEPKAVTVEILIMQLVDERADYFVSITCDGRNVTPHVFRERFKAEYEVAHYQWIFGLRPEKPKLRDYNETMYPNLTHDEILTRERTKRRLEKSKQ